MELVIFKLLACYAPKKVIIMFYCEHLLRNVCEPTVLLECEGNLPVIQNMKYLVLQDNTHFLLS